MVFCVLLRSHTVWDLRVGIHFILSFLVRASGLFLFFLLQKRSTNVFVLRKENRKEWSELHLWYISFLQSKENHEITSPICEIICNRYMFTRVNNHMIYLIVRCTSMTVVPIIKEMIASSRRFPFVARWFKRIGELSSTLIFSTNINKNDCDYYGSNDQKKSEDDNCCDNSTTDRALSFHRRRSWSGFWRRKQNKTSILKKSRFNRWNKLWELDSSIMACGHEWWLSNWEDSSIHHWSWPLLVEHKYWFDLQGPIISSNVKESFFLLF